MSTREANFDGLVGLSHNYAGLSYGNIASTSNKSSISNPKEAALQGLEKMKFLSQLGLLQGVLPPQERPHLPSLKAKGYAGTDAEILSAVAKKDPTLLALCSSASSMWTANAATVSPSFDTHDKKIHFTPANLVSHYHRAIEAPTTSRALQAVFSNDQHFIHHAPLAAQAELGDEGAANHTRLCPDYGQNGVEIFVFGRKVSGGEAPHRYPARQTYEASKKIAQRHGVRNFMLVQQNPAVIDKGVFHNDVIAVGNERSLFFHEEAFLEREKTLREIKNFLGDLFQPIEVKSSQLSVEAAVQSYLFNSQLVTDPQGQTLLISPSECQENAQVKAYLEESCGAGKAIERVHFKDVKQSMRNGGGPACLRLRVVLDEAEQAAVNPKCWYGQELHAKLEAWIEKHYRDQLSPSDLADPQLLIECQTALDELTQIMALGSIYDFQS